MVTKNIHLLLCKGWIIIVHDYIILKAFKFFKHEKIVKAMVPIFYVCFWVLYTH
jgi:hypothetical protein